MCNPIGFIDNLILNDIQSKYIDSKNIDSKTKGIIPKINDSIRSIFLRIINLFYSIEERKRILSDKFHILIKINKENDELYFRFEDIIFDLKHGISLEEITRLVDKIRASNLSQTNEVESQSEGEEDQCLEVDSNFSLLQLGSNVEVSDNKELLDDGLSPIDEDEVIFIGDPQKESAVSDCEDFQDALSFSDEQDNNYLTQSQEEIEFSDSELEDQVFFDCEEDFSLDNAFFPEQDDNNLSVSPNLEPIIDSSLKEEALNTKENEEPQDLSSKIPSDPIAELLEEPLAGPLIPELTSSLQTESLKAITIESESNKNSKPTPVLPSSPPKSEKLSIKEQMKASISEA